MTRPTPSLRAYGSFTATVLLTFAVLQYAGIFFGRPGEIDWSFLLATGVTLPVAAYAWSLVVANIPWVPVWESMNRTDR